METWKDIIGFEDYYQANELGEIRNKKRKVILKSFADRKGYRRIVLQKNGQRFARFVHRLVVGAFVGASDMIIDHINANRSDNRLENLRYCTYRENASFFWGKGREIGITWNKEQKYWLTRILYNKKRIHLGCYKTEKEASDAYQKALDEINKGNAPIWRNPKRTSKYKYVCFNKKNKNWMVFKSKKYYGSFDTEESAYEFTKTI